MDTGLLRQAKLNKKKQTKKNRITIKYHWKKRNAGPKEFGITYISLLIVHKMRTDLDLSYKYKDKVLKFMTDNYNLSYLF